MELFSRARAGSGVVGAAGSQQPEGQCYSSPSSSHGGARHVYMCASERTPTYRVGMYACMHLCACMRTRCPRFRVYYRVPLLMVTPCSKQQKNELCVTLHLEWAHVSRNRLSLTDSCRALRFISDGGPRGNLTCHGRRRHAWRKTRGGMAASCAPRLRRTERPRRPRPA